MLGKSQKMGFFDKCSSIFFLNVSVSFKRQCFFAVYGSR